MVLMAAHGEILPMPDCAIFADTGNEPSAVYDHLRWLMSPNVLPFPVHIVSVGNLGEEILRSTRGESNCGSYARPPFFVKNHDGSRGILRRQCTGDYKIDPIRKKVRELLGLVHRQRAPKTVEVEQWMGISADEKIRAKPSQHAFVVNRFPLIESRMSRGDCIEWLKRHNYPIPSKSACVFCPYRSNEEWRILRDTDPAGWTYAVKLDAAVREGLSGPGSQGKLFVHDDLVPLSQVDLSTAEDHGQLNFLDECEGMCGV
jgi:hypothetical protein